MKKSLRKLTSRYFRRVGAFLSALCLSFSFMLPFASAASDTEADMPTKEDFLSHRGSWFVWRTRDVNGLYYELCSSPIFFDSSGNFDASTSEGYSYKSSSYFDIAVISGSDLRYYYACSLPVPFAGHSGFWSELPSFPVGSTADNIASCCVSLYSSSSSSWCDSTYFVFLSPCSSFTPSSVSFSSSIGSSTDSITAAEFPTPLYSFPFAFRSESSSNRTSYVVQGGDASCINTTHSSSSWLSFKTNKFLVKPDSFSPYPSTYSCPSSDLGLVVIKQAFAPSGGTLNSASAFSPFTSFRLIPTLLVPVGMLPDVKVGDWVSDSPDDLQKSLTNEFGIDSGTLKNSKDNLNSWNSTSSVDSDVASGATGFLNGIFQNLGTFLFSVSLLCFGAVVLRMLIRKAVDG